MFDGIEVNIIGMALEVPFIANDMFPEPPLPDSALALLLSARRQPFACGNSAREARLDSLPAAGEVRIAQRQRPEAVQMIGQHDDGVDRKGSVPANNGEGGAKFTDVLGQQPAAAFEQRDREEERATRHERAEVAGHIGILPRASGGMRCAFTPYGPFPPYGPVPALVDPLLPFSYLGHLDNAKQ
jgi:hypothetical protein